MLTRTASTLTRTSSRLTSRTARRIARAASDDSEDVSPVGSPVWPMAVGAVLAPQGFTGRTRTEDRLKLALGAYRMGYFLLDLIDVPAWDGADDARGWAPVWDLVLRTRADAVVVHSRQDRRLPAPPVALRRLPVRLVSRDGY